MITLQTSGPDLPTVSLMDRTPWWRRLFVKTRRLRERADWAHFAGPDWAERIFDTPVTDDFHAKQGRTTGRCVLEREGRKLNVYLKRHYRLPWWQGVLAALWPRGDWSPALREFHHLSWARAQGLAVPQVVAAGEYLRPVAKLRSFLAIEELTDMLPLHEAIPAAERNLDAPSFQRWKAGLSREVARLASFLHKRHYYHKDLYLCHFYVPAADTRKVPAWLGRVHMIDFHRLGRHPFTGLWWRIKDLGQLLFSSAIPGVNARDRLRFWRYYLGPTRGSAARWLAWCICRKGHGYRRHNDKKKAL